MQITPAKRAAGTYPCLRSRLHWRGLCYMLLKALPIGWEIWRLQSRSWGKILRCLSLIGNLIRQAAEGSESWELINTGRLILNPCYCCVTKLCPKALLKHCKKVVFVCVANWMLLSYLLLHRAVLCNNQIQCLSKVCVMLYSRTNKRMFKGKADIPSLTFCTFVLHHTSNIILI